MKKSSKQKQFNLFYFQISSSAVRFVKTNRKMSRLLFEFFRNRLSIEHTHEKSIEKRDLGRDFLFLFRLIIKSESIVINVDDEDGDLFYDYDRNA